MPTKKGMKLPPGATLVTDDEMKLPPGATLVTGDDAVDNRPGMPAFRQPDMQISGLGKLHRIATDPGSIVPAIAKGMQQTEQSAQVNPEDSIGTATLKRGADASIGAMKGALHTGLALSPLINKIPYIGETLAPSSGIANAQAIATPKGTAQKVGYTGEQMAEWMLPTGAEGKAATITGRLLANSPKIGRIAVPAAKIGASAMDAGIRNKIQGGTFTGGAVTGGIASGIGHAGKAVAPKVVEAALGVGKRIRGALPEGANIGKAVLEDTTAVRPQSIANQLTAKIADYSNQVDQAARRAEGAGKTVSLEPARQVVKDATDTALKQRSRSQLADLEKIREQLTHEPSVAGKTAQQSTVKAGAGFVPVAVAGPSSPVPIPSAVSPVDARAIKQGIGMDISTWSPANANNINPVQQRLYGAINQGFHAAVPEAAPLDSRMAELIPAYKAASGVANNGGIIEDVSNRVARPTGALVSAAVGGAAGAAKGGIPGAILGSVGSLTAPAIASLPTTKMIAARVLYNPNNARRVILPALSLTRGAGLGSYDDDPSQ